MPEPKPKKRKRRKPKGVVIQKHHPSYHQDDERFTIPLRMAQHQSIWRTVQRLKNTAEHLRQIGNMILALNCEYILRYRELLLKGEITNDFHAFRDSEGNGPSKK